MTEPQSLTLMAEEPTGITSTMLMWGILVAIVVTVAGLVTLSASGGVNSTDATNKLLLLMTPILTGMMALLVSKMTAMHKQFNSRMDEFLKLARTEAFAEGVSTERQTGSARAADVAVQVARITAEKAVADQAAAEGRTPEGSE